MRSAYHRQATSGPTARSRPGPGPGPRPRRLPSIAILAAGCATSTGTAAQPQHAASPSRGYAGYRRSVRAASPQPRTASFPILVPVPPTHATSPQTRAFPSAATAAFRAEMIDLWAAVASGKPAYGMRAFFPLGAYRQVKAIADPTSDWHTRLVADFVLDVRAAHDLLGHAARAARLVRVIVPESRGQLDQPRRLFQRRRLLARGGRPDRLPRAPSAAVDRHRVADLMARPVVRGALRRRAAQLGRRGCGPAG